MIVFEDKQSMLDYVSKHEVYDSRGRGAMTMCPACGVWCVFSSRREFDRWDAAGRPVQLSLF